MEHQEFLPRAVAWFRGRPPIKTRDNPKWPVRRVPSRLSAIASREVSRRRGFDD